MRAKIKILEIKKENNFIKIDYKVSKSIAHFFDLNNKFQANYYENIESVPNSIAVIPFVSNVLPIIWLTDAELIIDELDKEYSESINNTRKSFNEMYKTDIFKGKVTIKKMIENTKPAKNKVTSVFCSGGVDSTLSLVECLKNGINPLLITIWGTDVWDYNEEGWESLKEYSQSVGSQLELKNLYIKTNFRKFIYEHELTEKLLKGKINDSWWRGIQHGIGLLGHVAPLAYLYNIETHYIPATLNEKNLGATCGSFPTIDESVTFINCNIKHSGYEYTRLEKVREITKYFKNNKINLRVCYMDKGNKLNCCQCEKCYLTIMELISIGENPRKWGFNITDAEISKIPNYLKKYASDSPINIEIWEEIIKYSYLNKKIIKTNSNYKWILKYRNQKSVLKYFYDKIKQILNFI